jgi:uncharacterized protein (TIGR02284 family)
MASNNDVDVLNDLIEVTLDSADGYRQAADTAKSPRLKDLFTRRAGQRQSMVRELQQRVRTLGGDPEDDGSILAAAHRTFLKLKDIVGDDDKNALEEVERGEDHIRNKYRDAAGRSDLSPTLKTEIQRFAASIQQDHDEVKVLRDAAKARG